MAESTHTLERVTSQPLLQAVNTSKLSAHLITQQWRQLLGARLFQRRRKKAADGLPGYFASRCYFEFDFQCKNDLKLD
jgi:hypothetical protein